MYWGLYTHYLQIPLYHHQINIMFILQVKIVRLIVSQHRDLRYDNQGHVVIVGHS